jgi:hypothetical protein
MSTTTTFDLRTAEAAAEPRKPGFLNRLIESRMRQARARVAHYLTAQSDETLADLGFDAEQIAEIRATGRIPASFWR